MGYATKNTRRAILDALSTLAEDATGQAVQWNDMGDGNFSFGDLSGDNWENVLMVNYNPENDGAKEFFIAALEALHGYMKGVA